MVKWGGAGEQIDVTLTNNHPDYTGQVEIKDGYVGVHSANWYYSSFYIGTFENGVKTDIYTNSGVTVTYTNGVLDVAINVSSTAYHPIKILGYKTD